MFVCSCVCDVGFAGDNCEVNLDDCVPSPCLNGGVCTDGDNSYTCSCLSGTILPICENETECTRASCSNHGECEVCSNNSDLSHSHNESVSSWIAANQLFVYVTPDILDWNVTF